jgi:hypothetical protein
LIHAVHENRHLQWLFRNSNDRHSKNSSAAIYISGDYLSLRCFDVYAAHGAFARIVLRQVNCVITVSGILVHRSSLNNRE